MLVLLGCLGIGNFFIKPDRAVNSRMLGHDFLAFYTAGTFARLGQFQNLYDLDATRDFEHTISALNGLDLGNRFGPFWNPPVYAWLLAPLSAMPYRSALSLWTGLNLVCLVIAIVLMTRMLPALVARPPKSIDLHQTPVPLKFKRDLRTWALLPLLVMTSMPFIQAISHGQNTCCSLLLLTLTVSAWRDRRGFLAGVACGLMFYKPQLALVVAVMLVLSLGLRALLGLGLIGAILLLITTFTMPGALDNYLYQLPANLKFMQVDHPYLWERHVTLLGFFRLLFQGRGAGEITAVVASATMFSCALIGLGLLGAWWRTRQSKIDDVWTGETNSICRDRFIAASIVSMPLLMPFYFDYDLLLMTVPAVLFAGEILALAPGTRLGRMQRVLLGGWTALYLWLMINAPVASGSRVNVAVILLTGICGISIARCIRRGVCTASSVLPQVQRVTVKRAA